MAKVEIVSRQSLANTAAARWKDAYCFPEAPYGGSLWRKARQKIWADLVALGEHPDPDEVNATTSDDNFTRALPCDSCNERKDLAAAWDQIVVCYDCLKEALTLADAVRNTDT